MKNDLKKVTALIGASFAATLATTAVEANSNPFGLNDLSSGYNLSFLVGDKEREGKCGEGKCGEGHEKEGEGKCGEGKCGEGHEKEGEGKCGEGKCGEGHEDKKDGEGKCGEGKCGS